MHGVILLSEVHPGNTEVPELLRQARDWYGLVLHGDSVRWRETGEPSMLQLITLCEQRARARGARLVLRDWTHLDYVGVPYVEPQFGFGLRDAIAETFDVVEAITVRHPLDQFLSMLRMEVMQDHLSAIPYLKGCAAFAEHAAARGFVRYEDFTNQPDTALRQICESLGIDYDPRWHSAWQKNLKVSGDRPGSGSRGADLKDIRPMPRPTAPAGLVEHFRANRDYLRTCELLGYEA